MSHLVQFGRVGSVTYNMPAPRASMPASVPVPPQGFIDRAAERSKVRDAVRVVVDADSRPPVVMLWGMAGAGKSALSRKLAAELASSYPDGALYAACGAEGDSPSEAVAGFLVALGVPEPYVPADFARRVDQGARGSARVPSTMDGAAFSAVFPSARTRAAFAALRAAPMVAPIATP